MKRGGVSQSGVGGSILFIKGTVMVPVKLRVGGFIRFQNALGSWVVGLGLEGLRV